MTSTLDEIRKFTKIVADTADVNAIEEFNPIDATTNPSLLLAATKIDSYRHFIMDSIVYARTKVSDTEKIVVLAAEKLSVIVGKEILKIVSGRVSTEIDAKLAFDIDAQVQRALSIIEMYKEEGVDKERVLIKIPSTWEGIQAAKILESKHKIHCNLTLLFNFHQAIACAEANVTLISPFVGRILDWHRKNGDTTVFDRHNDPGVMIVQKIYEYYKKFNYGTQIMGASFRNTEQIKGLVGCDLLTISASLLKDLSNDNEKVPAVLTTERAASSSLTEISVSESVFRDTLYEDRMAYDLLHDGVRKFADDGVTIQSLIRSSL